ncbi:MAG TPA: hypothetical protein VFS00_02715, partial [Polyangiaceae bacterium]|nr:hypothetical protein [Polyangiaceae bacterium]
LGDGAFDLLAAALARPETPRQLRGRLPLALAEFGTQRAANLLFAFLQSGDDGFVRYRCLRALEKMAGDHAVRLSPRDVQALVRRELTEHFRLLALRRALSPTPTGATPARALGPAPAGATPARSPSAAPTGTASARTHGPAPAGGAAPERSPGPTPTRSPSAAPAGVAPGREGARDLALRLLDEKRTQALGRVFGLLKLCFPAEDLRQVQAALASGDAARRATAAEFLDELLAPHRRQRDDGVRALLRLVTEDLPDEDRVTRAAALVSFPVPDGARAALASLRAGPDPTLAALAAELAGLLGERPTDRARPDAPPDASLSGIFPPAGAHGR